MTAILADEPNPFGYSDGMRRVGDAGTPITESGPLAEGETEGVIPPSPLWAMKVHRHFQWSHLLPHDERHERVRRQVGSGTDIVYLVDDGHHHRVVGRHLGRTLDGASYCLVARISRDVGDQLVAGLLGPKEAVLSGRGIALYGIVEDGPASNVFIVSTFDGPGAVPEEYLPPNPEIAFTRDLDNP